MATELWREEQRCYFAPGHPHEPHDRPRVRAEDPQLGLIGCQVVPGRGEEGLDVFLRQKSVRGPYGPQPDLHQKVAVRRVCSSNAHGSRTFRVAEPCVLWLCARCGSMVLE